MLMDILKKSIVVAELKRQGPDDKRGKSIFAENDRRSFQES